MCMDCKARELNTLVYSMSRPSVGWMVAVRELYVAWVRMRSSNGGGGGAGPIHVALFFLRY